MLPVGLCPRLELSTGLVEGEKTRREAVSAIDACATRSIERFSVCWLLALGSGQFATASRRGQPCCA